MRNLTGNPKLWLLVLLPVFLGIVIVFSRAQHAYDWIFVYYMSYDNDLSPFGKVILSDLQKGITNSSIAVVVQADFEDNKGMKRIGLYRIDGKIYRKESVLQSEDSADEGQLREYLKWVRKNWIARNYCIVFLNHGGTLDHMCRDQKPFRNHEKNKQFTSGKWLGALQTGKIVADFNRQTNGKVRLLFLQQCGRATIQNLYSFTGTSEYIMASPVVVGAPNTYYTQTLARLAQDPNVTGDALAGTIMQEDEHYTMYTLISNEELEKLPEKLAPVLNSFASVSGLNRPSSCSHLFEFESEKFYDLKSYFQALCSANNNIAAKELEIFFDWCENHLIVSKSIREPKPPTEPSCCGLSIYIPPNPDGWKRYSFLPLHRETNLEKAMKIVSN